MMAMLNGTPLKRRDGVRNISPRYRMELSPIVSLNEAIRNVPTMTVLRHVAPNRAMFTQGKVRRVSVTKNSAGGLKALSMEI